MASHATSAAIPTASTRERLVPGGIALQCAWCLDWIHEIREGEVPPTVAVSHGLCSDCVGRLVVNLDEREALLGTGPREFRAGRCTATPN